MGCLKVDLFVLESDLFLEALFLKDYPALYKSALDTLKLSFIVDSFPLLVALVSLSFL